MVGAYFIAKKRQDPRTLATGRTSQHPQSDRRTLTEPTTPPRPAPPNAAWASATRHDLAGSRPSSAPTHNPTKGERYGCRPYQRRPRQNHGQLTRVATTKAVTTMAGDGQTSRRYRQLRKTFRSNCEQNNTPCWLCSQPIDYTIPWPEEQSFELDHLHPRSTHPQHAEDPANFRASHRACNNKRGNKTPTANLGTLNRQWLKG